MTQGSTSSEVLQKLLVPQVSRAIVEQGHSSVEGPVVRAGDAVGLATPALLLEAYGFGGEGSPWGDQVPPYVDVLRFAVTPLMQLDTPRDGPQRSWPTYPNGFLRGSSLVPVWQLQRTRVPVGTEFWRIAETGEQRLLSSWTGLVGGWRGAPGYQPPVHLVGPRARWRGLDLPAEPLPDEAVALVALGPSGPEGFEELRPQVWRRVVPVAECDSVFEVLLTAVVDEVAVRVLQRTPQETLVLLLDGDLDAARRLEATQLEPGVFEAVVASTALEEVSGVTRELPVAR